MEKQPSQLWKPKNDMTNLEQQRKDRSMYNIRKS